MKDTIKKLLAMALALTLVLALAACGGSSAPATQAPAAEEPAAEEPAAEEPAAEAPADDTVYTCVAALHTTAGAIEDQTVQRFSELLKEATDGHVDVQVFAGASLGTEQENLSQIQSNEVQFVLFGDVFLSQVLQDYNATSIPFVYSDIDSAVAYWESVSDVIDPIVADAGMYIVGREYRAPRQLTANKAINTPADLAGVKLRVPETTFYLKVWGALGAIATPVNWSEIFTALQTHVVDAQENPIETYYDAGLCEVQSHTMLTSHINTFYTWTVNKDFYDSLPEEYQKAFDECAAQALDECNAGLMDRQDAVIEKMLAEGHTIVDVDTEVWTEAAMDSILECADSLAPEARAAVYEQLGMEP